ARREAPRRGQGALGWPEHAAPDRARPDGEPDPSVPDGRAVRGRAPDDQGHDHGDHPPDEPRGGRDVPDRVARDGHAAPALPQRPAQARAPAGRRDLRRRYRPRRRGRPSLPGGLMALLELEGGVAGYVGGIDILGDLPMTVAGG